MMIVKVFVYHLTKFSADIISDTSVTTWKAKYALTSL